jgi:hypothetical protein
MNCCQCKGIEDLFDQKLVEKELKDYRSNGPEKTTRMMVGALKAENVQGLSLLDIGGGVGAVQHALIDAGVADAVDVDASQAYIHAARDEAKRRGILDKIRFWHGNFVEIAPQLEPVDIVTLDRVVCCYPDMENLVRLSAARAKKLYGLVYPRDAWWVKAGIYALNLFFRLRRSPFRTFVHPTQSVDALIRGQGLRPYFYRRTLVWQVVVYSR